LLTVEKINKMNWKNKKVLVTGAGGFIGSHLAERLAKSGARVRVFLRYNSRGDRGMIELLPPELQAKMDIFWGDLRDPETVRRAVKGMEFVFHLGALIAIPYSYVNPREVFETNLGGMLNILNAARDFKTHRVISTSTSEVYGTARYAPIDEEHPLQAQSPYSASKIAADKACESFFRSFDLPVTIVRPFNTFGPRQSARAVIPTIITQALTRRTIKLGSLDPTRDMNYVENVVDGFLAAAASKKALGETVNIGSGKEISIGDLAEKIIRLTGTSAKLAKDPKRVRPERSEVFRLIADCTKARKLLGWRPKVSLDEGLKLTIAWIRDHLDRYRPELYNI